MVDCRHCKGSRQLFANWHQQRPTPLQRFVTVYAIDGISVEIALHQQFEKQRLQGVIDQTGDLQELKELAKQLVDLYFKQKPRPPGLWTSPSRCSSVLASDRGFERCDW